MGVSKEARLIEHRRPLVAIVGRPNVGKSTLFNRLVGSRFAITDDQPGVTRDRLYAEVEWIGRHFTLVDTGGLVPRTKDEMEKAVLTQAEQAIAEADLVVLLCDVSAGVTDADLQVAAMLRRSGRANLVVVNKVDHPEQAEAVAEFFSLGLGDPVPVSAVTGRRSGDLLDTLTRVLELDPTVPEEKQEAIAIAIAGRPNAGKSTMINRLADCQVSIVDSEPGTTRDATSIRLEWEGRSFLLTDTAGLRHRSKVDGQVEYYSGLRAGHAIGRADVVLLLLDAVEGVTVQDARIMSQVTDTGRGLIVVANKWDQLEKRGIDTREYTKDMHARFPFLLHYPILFSSGLTGKGVWACLREAVRVWEIRRERVATPRLNKFMSNVVAATPPAGNLDVRVYYMTQQGIAPPTFVAFVNHPKQIPEAYKRFVENHLRREFGFSGTPVRILFRRNRRGAED
ncbi:MAG: ribosome biogenesis GTPase Der [Candidatus Latescibacteria bacterium]|nr:ribosome biogenesis GTPase Der [Candidatus Latescibacterota bacterium]